MFRMIKQDEPKWGNKLSSRAKNLLSQLLEKDSSKRLGCTKWAATQVKEHPFFREIDWNQIIENQYPVPEWLSSIEWDKPPLERINQDEYSSSFATECKPLEIDHRNIFPGFPFLHDRKSVIAVSSSPVR
jgi:serine/threonine protein kinase